MFFGVFIDRWLSRDVQYSRAWMRTPWISLIVVGIAFLIGSRILLESVLPDETHLMLIGLIPLIGGVIGWWAYEVDRRQAAAMTVLATAAAFTLALLPGQRRRLTVTRPVLRLPAGLVIMPVRTKQALKRLVTLMRAWSTIRASR